MTTPQTMYRAFCNFESLSLWHPDSPAPTFCSSMELSPCGEYVLLRGRRLDDQGWETHREKMSRFWQPTQAQALGEIAPALRRIGERLMRQADELEQAARDEISDRPALAEAADSSRQHGSPTGSGE